ncbi:uncharacterized protein BKCO1_6500020 [Diplodia corticola]|uniref:Uncharacterized protein n=1 Tax=Diplodia corticola TaxID=236234 RepID=A0A1J9RCG4_9PEZI|nr:uncharacterized protein BKCO1_6500020 [Diplodia corticola]OJD30171.1 hypothetical protein BKCO1_6500020 [Diplodia corticola]
MCRNQQEETGQPELARSEDCEYRREGDIHVIMADNKEAMREKWSKCPRYVVFNGSVAILEGAAQDAAAEERETAPLHASTREKEGGGYYGASGSKKAGGAK